MFFSKKLDPPIKSARSLFGHIGFGSCLPTFQTVANELKNDSNQKMPVFPFEMFGTLYLNKSNISVLPNTDVPDTGWPSKNESSSFKMLWKKAKYHNPFTARSDVDWSWSWLQYGFWHTTLGVKWLHKIVLYTCIPFFFIFIIELLFYHHFFTIPLRIANENLPNLEFNKTFNISRTEYLTVLIIYRKNIRSVRCFFVTQFYLWFAYRIFV